MISMQPTAILFCLLAYRSALCSISESANLSGRFQKKSGRFTPKGVHDRLKNFTEKVKNRWQRYRNPDMEENIEMVRLDHSYGEPPERRDQADIDEVAYEIIVYDTSDDEAAVDLSWQDGRRIVELGVLSDQLAACKECFHPLNLQNCVGEKRYGLGSMLYVACSNPVCNHKNRLVLGKRTFNDDQKRGLPSWDVNRKADGGELHSIPNFVAIEKFVITYFTKHVISQQYLDPSWGCRCPGTCRFLAISRLSVDWYWYVLNKCTHW